MDNKEESLVEQAERIEREMRNVGTLLKMIGEKVEKCRGNNLYNSADFIALQGYVNDLKPIAENLQKMTTGVAISARNVPILEDDHYKKNIKRSRTGIKKER